MAKFGIALGSGPRGLGFKSRHSDHGRVPQRTLPLLFILPILNFFDFCCTKTCNFLYFGARIWRIATTLIVWYTSSFTITVLNVSGRIPTTISRSYHAIGAYYRPIPDFKSYRRHDMSYYILKSQNSLEDNRFKSISDFKWCSGV